MLTKVRRSIKLLLLIHESNAVRGAELIIVVAIFNVMVLSRRAIFNAKTRVNDHPTGARFE
jgi:hypothetical protein